MILNLCARTPKGNQMGLGLKPRIFWFGLAIFNSLTFRSKELDLSTFEYFYVCFRDVGKEILESFLFACIFAFLPCLAKWVQLNGKTLQVLKNSLLAGSTFPLKNNSPLSNVPDETLKTYFDRVQGMYACKACGKTEKSHSNMRYHVESRHYSPGYFCPNCGKRFQIILHRQRHQKTCFLLRTLDIR